MSEAGTSDREGPRVLVVRSGANPFARLPTRTGLAIVERVSHSIAPLPVPPAVFERHADYVVFTSQVTAPSSMRWRHIWPAEMRVHDRLQRLLPGAGQG